MMGRAAVLLVLAAAARAADPVIFEAGEANITCYRIPLVVATGSSIRAFAEARRLSCNDDGPKSIATKTSGDGGNTWSAVSFIYGDPAGAPASFDGLNLGSVTIIDQSSIVLHFTECGHACQQAGLYSIASTDGGATWSKPTNLTSVLQAASLRGFFPGPSAGIQLAAGNRVLVPGWYRDAKGGLGSTVMLSDDAGSTWSFGQLLGASGTGAEAMQPNEATIVDTGMGTVLLNMRDGATGAKPHTRLLSTSSDNGKTWTAPQRSADLPDPGCAGSMLASPTGAIFFTNADSSASRTNGTLKASRDGGSTWQLVEPITPAGAYFGYSAAVGIPQYTTGKDDVGVAYESSGSPVSISWHNWLQADDDNFA